MAAIIATPSEHAAAVALSQTKWTAAHAGSEHNKSKEHNESKGQVPRAHGKEPTDSKDQVQVPRATKLSNDLAAGPPWQCWNPGTFCSDLNNLCCSQTCVLPLEEPFPWTGLSL